MIVGERITERQYRALEALSQTMIRDFYRNRKKFYKEYLLKEVDEDEKDEDELLMRRQKLVHCLLLEEHEFDNKFMTSICTEVPTGLMLKFVMALAKHHRAAVDEEGIMRSSFAEIAQLAHADSGFKWDLDRVLKEFREKQQPEYFYQELVAAKISRKTIVTAKDIDICNGIVTSMRTGEFTGRALNNEGGDGTIEVFTELPITEGLVVEGRPMKALLDRLVINHQERYLQPEDVKIVWTVENFFDEYYTKKYGYIQAAVYDLAVAHLRDIEYQGYEVRPMRYLVADSANYYAPLMYELSQADLRDAYLGFEHRGRKYKGLVGLIRELNWHMDNNVWNMSMDNYNNGGVIQISSLKRA